MTRAETTTRKLERVREKLVERGDDELARELETVIADLKPDGQRSASSDILTTGQAAELLGVRSLFTIKRWAREGILDGFVRGGRIMVTRESVERLLNSPSVADQRAMESDLAAFDPGDASLPVTSGPGRRPWKSNVTRDA